MALGTLAGYYGWAQATPDGGAADTSIQSHLTRNADAIKRLCSPFLFEPQTFTDIVLDAPWASDILLIPDVPVRSITSLYYRQDARGVVANFTSADLLVAGTDYRLLIDDRVNNWSKAGRVQRLNRSIWGADYRRPFAQLGVAVQPESGSVLVTYAAGCLTVPPAVEEALYIMTALTRGRRATGAPVASSSWNGYSESFPGPLTSTAALDHPDVQRLLAPFITQIRLGS